LNIAGSNICCLPTGASVNYAISKLSGQTSFFQGNVNNINTIGVGVADMNLWFYQVHMPDVVSMSKEINIKPYTSTLRTLTSGTSDEFNVDFKQKRRITHIACAFVQKKGSLKTSPTDFSSGFFNGGNIAGVDVVNNNLSTESLIYNNSPIAQLFNIRIEYAGAVYPFTPYNFNFDYTPYGAQQGLSNSTYRSFYDFCNFSDGLRDRNGILLNSDQYIIAPVFLFKTYQNPNNEDNTCLITVDFKTTITGANLLVMGFYDETYELLYGADGKFDTFSHF